MKKYLILLLSALSFITGCNELINISGIFINRAVNHENINKELILSVRSVSGKSISDFKISILNETDSLLIFNPQYTSTAAALNFQFQDEQINPLNTETKNLIIIAEHPYIGTFQQIIPITKLYQAEPIIIEFYIGEVQDSLPKPPLNLYKEYKY